MESCEHDRQEYKYMEWGEEVWKCLACGEEIRYFIDTLGG